MEKYQGVASPSGAVLKMQQNWQIVDPLMEGTKGMREAGQMLLPKWPAESDEDYLARKESSFLYNVYKRTVTTLTGKPFSKPVTWNENLDPEVVGWFDDVDKQGNDLHAFAEKVFMDALARGHGIIMADYPVVKQNADGQVLSVAEEKALGLRPQLVHIFAKQVLGWKTETVNGVEVITQFRYIEDYEESNGDFGATCKERIRVIEPQTWREFRKNERGEWDLYAEGINTLGRVAISVIYGQRCGLLRSEPPLMDLAYANVEHWQSSSDQRSILHTARMPVFATIGLDTFAEEGSEKKVIIGSKFGMNLPLGADAKFVEHSGAAIEAGRNDLKDLESRMQQLGAEMLVTKPGTVTATHDNIESAKSQSALQSMCRQAEDALELAVYFMMLWAKKPATMGEIEIKLYQDFATVASTGNREKILMDSANSGLISNETYYTELQRGGMLVTEDPWSAEQERLANQQPRTV